METKYGTEDAGFSIQYEDAQKRLCVTGWGYWQSELPQQFGTVVVQAIRTRPGSTPVRMVMSAMKPMSQESLTSFADILEAAGAKVTVETRNALIRLQLLQIVNKTRAKDRVEFIST